MKSALYSRTLIISDTSPVFLPDVTCFMHISIESSSEMIYTIFLALVMAVYRRFLVSIPGVLLTIGIATTGY